MTNPVTFAPGDWAVALIICDNEIVLIHRQKPDHDYYVLPGGSIELGETPASACMCEVQEETNLEPTVTTYLCTFINGERVEHYFLVGAAYHDSMLGGPEQARQDVDNQYTPLWIDRARLERLNIQPPEVRHLILAHLSQVRYRHRLAQPSVVDQ